MSGQEQTEETKSSKLKWLLPIGLLIVFLGGVFYSRSKGPFTVKQLPELAPLNQQDRQIQSAPDIEMTDLTGKKYKLSDFRGKAVLVNFWSTTCPACLMELKSLESLSQQLTGKPFALLAITDNSRDEIKQFLDETGLKLPVYFDPDNDAHRKYQVMYLPASFVIDPQGNLVDQVPGAADWGNPQVITYFQKLIEITPSKGQPKKPSP
jgi:peroxiredoxin